MGGEKGKGGVEGTYLGAVLQRVDYFLREADGVVAFAGDGSAWSDAFLVDGSANLLNTCSALEDSGFDVPWPIVGAFKGEW